MYVLNSRRTLWTCGAVAFLIVAVPAALALIKLEFPVSRMYRDSKVVRSATIVSVDAARAVLEAGPAATFKGGAAPDRLRLAIAAPTNVVARVAVGQPVVLFCAESENAGAAIIHLADTWLLAQAVPEAKPPVLRIVQNYDAAKAFPGRTASLVRLLTAMKNGKSPLEDKIDPACLEGTPREVANLGVRATFLEVADLNGDARPDLLVGAADGVRLWLAGAKGYTDATDAWGLRGLRAERAAVGDVNGDGRPDVLLGATLLLRQGDKFVRAEPALETPPEADWAAAALADVTGDGKADGVVLSAKGELTVLTNPGEPGKPWPRNVRRLWTDGPAAVTARFSADWGDDGKLHVLVARAGGITRYAVAPDGPAPMPFPQLTGAEWLATLKIDGLPAGAVKSVACDYDGNGKLDWLLLAGNDGVVLLNRGFGAYYADYSVHPRLRPQPPKAAMPFAIGPGAILAGGALQQDEPPRQNLLVLTEEGRLYEVPNTVGVGSP